MKYTNKSWPYPSIIAHRGAGRFAPENTLASIRAGARHGFGMVEFDVKLSQDGVAILLHDDTVDRTSNGTGSPANLSFAELARLDFGCWHSAQFAGEPVATLYSAAAFARANTLCCNIEIKPCPGAETRTGAVVAQLAQQLWNRAAIPPLLSSFSTTALDAALSSAPALPRALLIPGQPPTDWLRCLNELDCLALNINHEFATQELIQEAHAKGYKIACWTVNTAARARELLDWGCDALFTDEITTITPNF